MTWRPLGRAAVEARPRVLSVMTHQTTLGRRVAAATRWSDQRSRQSGPAVDPQLPGTVDAIILLLMALRRDMGPWLRQCLRLLRHLAIPAGLLLLTLGYLGTNLHLPTRPHGLLPAEGWWAWYDQGKTLQAMLGWHAHAPDATNQWYQPLYPLAGALGMDLTPKQPFLLPDLLGLLASFLLFVPLAATLGVGRLIAVSVFLAITLGEPEILQNWVIPWNTSLTTPLLLLGLLAAARIGLASRRRAVWAAGLGAAVGLLPALRPTDMLVLLPATFLAGLAVIADRSSWRRTGVIAGAAAAGLGVGLMISLALYVPIFGLRASPYMVLSGRTGFDWRLLPLHWITLVVGPRPLFPGRKGLIEVFWWLVPCFVGVVAVLLRRLRTDALDRRRLVHLMMLGGIAPYWCLYLSYRDLHPVGLWGYHNFHYFMWSMPPLGLYGVFFLRCCAVGVRIAWRGERRRGMQSLLPVIVATLFVGLSLCWRPQLGPWPQPRPAMPVEMQNGEILIPGGLSNIRDALLVSALDPHGRIYFGDHSLSEGGRTFGHFTDFRAFPIPGGMMVLPLRRLPHADGVLRFDPAVRLDPTVPPALLRQDMMFGLPCWVPRAIRPDVCAIESPLPGPLFPTNHQIDFDSKMEGPYLIPGGWTDQWDGRWTLGYHSSLQFRVPTPRAPGEGVVIEVEGAGFMPRGSDILAVDVSANGRRLMQWRISTTREVALRVNVPATVIPADGEVRLTLSALNARRPSDTIAGDNDHRLLGFRVRAVRLLPWSVRGETNPPMP